MNLGVNMEERKDYEYKAVLPSEEGKKKKFGGGMAPAPISIQPEKRVLTTAEFEDPKDKEMINRVLKRVRLSSGGWQALKEDLENHEPKDYISRRFGIKSNDLKWLKRYLGFA
jgi:hypothetical protein